MKICIPVTEDQGIKSPVSEHFGSAPLFMVVDTDTEACRGIPNRNEHHAHGMCMPLASLQGEQLDGVVVGGIGMGALLKLQAGGLQVFLSEYGTVAETLQAFKAGKLRKMAPGMACGGHEHGHGGGCGHGHP
jgi:predicted Fe-Mo cluster-binding NifX family protein